MTHTLKDSLGFLFNRSTDVQWTYIRLNRVS